MLIVLSARTMTIQVTNAQIATLLKGALSTMKEETRQEILQESASSLFEGLGKVNGVKAKLQLKPGARPRISKPRPVPFASKDIIAEELHKWV